jgi:hypothetical protein
MNMSSILVRSVVVCTAVALLWTVGCEQARQNVGQPAQAEGKVIQCKTCYEAVVTTMRQHPKGGAAGPRHRISRMKCADCKSDMETYSEGGKLMMQCAKCAPAGVECDKCRPAKSAPEKK